MGFRDWTWEFGRKLWGSVFRLLIDQVSGEGFRLFLRFTDSGLRFRMHLRISDNLGTQ